jgi:serine/threonine-protein kinase
MEYAAADDPLIGAQVGNYEVKRKLGEGGMGAVYLAEHPLIGKKVALKVLHAEFASNDDVVSRFFNEAKAVNDIQHPNIVDIIDYGVIPRAGAEAMVYFIMEFLGGRSLADIVRNESPLAPERALRVSLQIADALGASHRANIVHRDLKPDNVILINRRREPDFVKVLDFGIAKLTGDQPGSRRTRTGIVMGTPAYMSPEQCEGRGEVDHRTDVYALGILLYEMLTGRVPFEGEGYGEVLVQHLTQAPQKPSTIRGLIPPHIEAVCLRALEKRADDRYPSMDEFMRALADPVSYVEGAGGVQHFTTANLGAPQATPYPAHQIAPPTPLPTQLAPATPAGMSPPTPLPQPNPHQASWPSPVPGAPTVAGTSSRKLPLILVAVLAIAGLAVAGIVLMGGGGDEDDGVAAAGLDAGTLAGGDVTGSDGVAPDTTVLEPEPEPEPDVEPEPEPEPKKPEMVRISVVSEPPGAKVYRAGKEIGTTPVSFDLEKGEEKVPLTVKRRGYDNGETSFVPDINQRVFLKLVKIKRRTTSSGTKSGGKGSGSAGSKYGKDGTLNPF